MKGIRLSLSLLSFLSFSWSGLLCLRSSRSKCNISTIDDLPKSRRLHSVSACGCSAEQARFIGDTVKPRERWQILVNEAEKALEMSVKHCLWGTCSSDSRFPRFCKGVCFVPFAKSTRTLERCLRWSKAYGRASPQPVQCQQNYIFLYYSKRSQFRTRKERLSQ